MNEQQYIKNEKNGLTYRRVGDYYLPCLSLPEEDAVTYGPWGIRRQQFLREHRKVAYYNLLTDGTLSRHLAEVDAEANNLMHQLMTQMSKAEGISENLKANHWIEWVTRMENIRSRAEEIVMQEIIYA